MPTSVVSSPEKIIGWVASTRPWPTGGAVDVEGDRAALGEAAAVVVELHPHLVVARGEVGVGVDLEVLDAEQVVAVGGLAVVDVERPAAEAAALGDDDAACPGRGDR